MPHHPPASARDVIIPPPSPQIGEEGRAFPVYSAIPPYCTTFREDSTRHWPHVKAGETVIVDTREREITFGELYLLSQTNGPVLWQIVPETRGLRTSYPCVTLRPLFKPQPGEVPLEQLNWSDGPLLQHFAEQFIIGRVIGLLVWPKLSGAEIDLILCQRYGSDRRAQS